MKNILGTYSKAFIFFFVLGAGITFALGQYIQFHSTGNDFWNVLYYGRNMTLSQPESLYNGFYPVGYAFLIGQMPFTYILPIAYIINALLSGLLTASVSTLIFYTRNFFAVCIAFFGSLFAPFIFQSTHTIGPDLGAASFVSFAIFLLWKNHFEIESPSPSFGRGGKGEGDFHAFLIGAFLGLGFLTRTHVIVSAIAIFIAYGLIFGIRPLRSHIIMVSTFLCFVLIQVIINLVSGHGALETAQSLNMYKFLYSVDWTYPPTPAELENFSLLKVILETPELFFPSYWGQLRFITSYAWTPLLCFVLSPKGHFVKFSLFSFLTIILYSIPVVVGDSARAPLMVMAAYVSCMALIPVVISDLFQKIFKNLNFLWAKQIIGFAFILLFINLYNGWLLYDTDYIQKNYEGRKTLEVIETTLIKNGMQSPSEVFSDRYNFYTPHTMPYRSRQIGNWNIDWVWGYSTEFPPLPNDSWQAFAKACKEQGIHYLVISPNSDFRGEIFSQIYYDKVDIELLKLKFIGQRGNMRLYKFK